MQELLFLKQKLRRQHECIAKEYSLLHQAVSQGTQLRDKLKQVTLSALTNNEEVEGKYVVLAKHEATVDAMMNEGNVMLEALSSCDRELQNVMSLVDRASDIEVQCMSGSIADVVICNGSPLYPNQSVNDADAIASRCATVCTRSGRLSTLIRRVVCSCACEVQSAAQQISTSLSVNERVSSEKVVSAQRRLEGIQWEQRKSQQHIEECDQEEAQLNQRLEHVRRAIGLRRTAKEFILTKDGRDVVEGALRSEEQQLLSRARLLQEKKHHLEAEVAKLQSDAELCGAEIRRLSSSNLLAIRNTFRSKSASPPKMHSEPQRQTMLFSAKVA